MASKGHDLIVSMLQIKLKLLGFTIIALENPKDKELIKTRNLPPKILRHRPDLIAIRGNTICIGEAKYFGDFKTKHSQEQINDFIELANKRDDVIIIFGIPMSEKKELLQFLDQKIALEKTIILEVPDRLIEDEKKI